MSIKLRRFAALVANQDYGGALPYVALENVESWTGHLSSSLEELPERKVGEVGLCLIEPGDVLFGKLRPYLAKVWRASDRFYASSELLAIRGRQGVESRGLSTSFCLDQQSSGQSLHQKA